MKIIADDKIPFLRGVFEEVAEVKYLPGSAIKKEDILDADVMIIRTRTHCNKDLLEGTSVKFIATVTVGSDHLDIAWLEQAEIKWSNAKGCNSGAVCQYVASVLALLIKEGLNPHNTTIGIVGVGMVGSKVEKLAKTLGFKILLNDPLRARVESESNFVNLQTILKQSDIITFHTPLTFKGIDATYHLFDFNSLDLLKPNAVIINASRGEVINSQALLKGLESGKISKIILDVWENEPDFSKELLEKVRIGTPHIAGYSREGKINGTIMSVQAISRFFNLGLDNFRPELLPMPDNSIIKIDAQNKQQFEIAAEAILKTYNVADDDALLRANPDDFEKLRDNYMMRKEFGAWKIETTDKSFPDILKKLGFDE